MIYTYRIEFAILIIYDRASENSSVYAVQSV